MISKKTLQPLIWTYKLTSWLQTTSFYWNHEQQQLVLKPEVANFDVNFGLFKATFRFRLSYIRIFNVVYRILLIAFIGLNIGLRHDVQPTELFLSLYFETLLGITLSTLVLFLIWDAKYVNFVNSLLLLNSKLGESSVYVKFPILSLSAGIYF